MSLPIGAKVGRYTVEAVLGRGGLAEVYAATDDVSGDAVALKVLHATGPEVARRLLREGRALASLSHPNIVGVLDVIDAFGAPALVLERVRGPSLSEHMALGAVRDGDREAIAHGVLTPKLSDFGLVAVVEPDPGATRLTRTGVGLGTPGYLAPEQLTDARAVDRRADVFSAAVTLYRLFTGALPFPQRDPRGFLRAVSAADPERLAAALPGGRGGLLARCLSPSPEGRPEDAAALLQAWREAAGRPAAPPDQAAPERRPSQALSASVDFDSALSALSEGATWSEPRVALFLAGAPLDEAAGDRLLVLRGVAVDHKGGTLCLMRSAEDARALLDALADGGAAPGGAPRGGLAAGEVQLRQHSAGRGRQRRPPPGGRRRGRRARGAARGRRPGGGRPGAGRRDRGRGPGLVAAPGPAGAARAGRAGGRGSPRRWTAPTPGRSSATASCGCPPGRPSTPCPVRPTPSSGERASWSGWRGCWSSRGWSRSSGAPAPARPGWPGGRRGRCWDGSPAGPGSAICPRRGRRRSWRSPRRGGWICTWARTTRWRRSGTPWLRAGTAWWCWTTSSTWCPTPSGRWASGSGGPGAPGCWRPAGRCSASPGSGRRPWSRCRRRATARRCWWPGWRRRCRAL